MVYFGGEPLRILAALGIFWLRTVSGPGGIASSNPFHPQCACPEVGRPKSDHFEPFLGFVGPCRIRSTLKGDLLLRRRQKPICGIKMVRFGSTDLRTSALGVKRVRGSLSPWSRGRAGPKKRSQTAKIQKKSGSRPVRASKKGPITVF